MVAKKTAKAVDSKNIIMIEWADAYASNGWMEQTTPDDGVAPCSSVGRVVFEDKDQIVLAATWSGDHHNQRIAIPKSWVRKRTKIIGTKK